MQQQQHIHCIISNCNYWSPGNKCVASEILIASDDFGAQQPNRVDASVAKNLEPTTTQSCMATCCKTFVEKGSVDAMNDNIQRLS